MLNPKTALFFLSFIPQFVDRANGRVFLQFVISRNNFCRAEYYGRPGRNCDGRTIGREDSFLGKISPSAADGYGSDHDRFGDLSCDQRGRSRGRTEPCHDLSLCCFSQFCAALSVASSSAATASHDSLPRIEGESFTGEKVVLPDAAQGKVAVLIFGFSKASGAESRAWADEDLGRLQSQQCFRPLPTAGAGGCTSTDSRNGDFGDQERCSGKRTRSLRPPAKG